MSAVQAMERGYAAIKQMLRTGAFAPGARLDANRLAYELGISVTPVRDVLYRLAGEHMVDAAIGEGFHVPRFSEAGLRDLYEWHSALMSFAGRTIDITAAMAIEGELSSTAADRTAAMIERIADVTPNREVALALLSASDRLHQFRIGEAKIFEDIDSEFDEFRAHKAGIAVAIRRYHLRRMRAVPVLIEALDKR